MSVITTAEGPRSSRRSGGQGRLQNHEERTAIEKHAEKVTVEMLKAEGWQTELKGKPYDIRCTRDKEVLIVEVKGTTSKGTDVVLTKNEVKIQRESFPNNALAVVSEIELDRSGPKPSASGGKIKFIHPWRIELHDLKTLTYQYKVPANQT